LSNSSFPEIRSQNVYETGSRQKTANHQPGTPRIGLRPWGSWAFGVGNHEPQPTGACPGTIHQGAPCRSAPIKSGRRGGEDSQADEEVVALAALAEFDSVLPPVPKESPQQFGGFLGPDSPLHLHLVVELRMIQNFEH